MAYKYPFQDFAEELKPRVGGAHVDIDIRNIKSSFPHGKERIIDVVGEDVWDLMISHYNDSDNYNQENQSDPYYLRLDQLVSSVQDAMSQFVFMKHFIWLMLHISDSGVTVKKSEDETTAFKYLTDEAKNELIENAWIFSNNLIEFLNKEATKYTEWTKATDYLEDQIVIYNTKYYKSKADFTSTEDFDVANWNEVSKSINFTKWAETTNYLTDQVVRYSNKYYKANSDFTSGESFEPTNWTEIEDPAEIIFWQWTESDNYIDSKNILFESHKDFNKYYGINNSAYFFVKVRYILTEVIEEEVSPMLEEFDSLQKELHQNEISATNIKLLKIIKKAVAYRVMANAIMRFSYYELPRAIRFDLDNEHSVNAMIKSKRSDYLREKISRINHQEADKYFAKIDQFKEIEDIKENDTEYETDVETQSYDIDEDSKHILM